MAALKRKRDMACQPGSSGGSARLLFFLNTHCMGANGFAECLRRSTGGCYAHAFFLRRLCRGLSFGSCAGLLQGGGAGFLGWLCSLFGFEVWCSSHESLTSWRSYFLTSWHSLDK
jgi:hypothetical protein